MGYFGSGPYSTFHTYILGTPMITSKRTPWYLGLAWFCMYGIQFPTDPMMDRTPSTTPFWQMPSPAFPRDRTVHTIYFKIWDPDSPARSLYVEEINQQGIVRQFDPEHFFHKLTGDHVQANQMSDYWRSHYGLPLKHGGTPHHPTWASSTSPTTPSTIPTAAKHLATSSGTIDFPRSSLCGHSSGHHNG